MLAIISPAKSLDFETAPLTDQFSTPDFLDQSKKLIQVMRKKSEEEVAALMSISEKLAKLNVERYQQWKH